LNQVPPKLPVNVLHVILHTTHLFKLPTH